MGLMQRVLHIAEMVGSYHDQSSIYHYIGSTFRAILLICTYLIPTLVTGHLKLVTKTFA